MIKSSIQSVKRSIVIMFDTVDSLRQQNHNLKELLALKEEECENLKSRLFKIEESLRKGEHEDASPLHQHMFPYGMTAIACNLKILEERLMAAREGAHA